MEIAKTITEIQALHRSLKGARRAAIAKVSASGEWFDGQHGCLWGEWVIAKGGSFKPSSTGQYVPADPKTVELCKHALEVLGTYLTQDKPNLSWVLDYKAKLINP